MSLPCVRLLTLYNMLWEYQSEMDEDVSALRYPREQ